MILTTATLTRLDVQSSFAAGRPIDEVMTINISLLADPLAHIAANYPGWHLWTTCQYPAGYDEF